MARRDPSDSSAALARVQSTFQGGFTGFNEELARRREQQARLQELLLQGRLRREDQAADPEFQAKQTALQAIQQITPLPEARVSATASPEEASTLQALLRSRMTERLGERARLSEMFGLAPKRQPTLAETMAELHALQGGGGPSGTSAVEPGLSASGKPILRSTAQAEGARQATITGAKKAAELSATKTASQTDLQHTFGVLQQRLQAIPPPNSDVTLATKGIQEFAAKQGFAPAINEYLTATDAILGQIARAVSQERGALHNKDIERVAELVKQLPFLSGKSRHLRIETIDALMGKMGQGALFGEGASQTGGGARSFASPEEAEAANLPPGTRITVGGRPAVVE